MKKILIVENDGDTAELMEYILTEAGYEVIQSVKKIPVSELIKINPSLILLDHFLDGGLGSDYCAGIKASGLTRHIPVLLISAFPELNKIAVEACADGFIEKPFDIVGLEEMVKRMAL